MRVEDITQYRVCARRNNATANIEIIDIYSYSLTVAQEHLVAH